MKLKKLLALVGTALFVACSVQSVTYSKPPPTPLPEDQKRLDRIHDGAVRGDRSVVPDIVAVLNYPSAISQKFASSHFDPFSHIDPYFIQPVLRDAVRLHATEVLPQIQRIIDSTEDGNNSEASSLAHVIKARLLADDAVQGISNPKQQAAQRIKLFYAELGLAPSEINVALKDYNLPRLKPNGEPLIEIGYIKPIPIGVYALQEIADMMYVNGTQEYLALPMVQALNLKDDGYSSLKLRFAAKTPAERGAVLAEGLADWKRGAEYDARETYIKNLAIDEGPVAAQAAVDKIQQMEAHPEQYPENGFYDLIDVVTEAGDKQQGARLEKIHDDRQKVASRLDAAVKSLKSKPGKLTIPGS